MKKKYIIAFLLFCLMILPFRGLPQINRDGLPFIDTYTDADFGEAGQIWAITQDTRGVMYFGCNYGLKTFDGKQWKTYHLESSTIIKSLDVDENGVVYYGAESDFGVILTNSKGGLEFYSISANIYKKTPPDYTSVWKTLVIGKKVYFQSFEKIFTCDLPIQIDKNQKLVSNIEIIQPEKTQFHLSFNVFDKLYVREWEKGLCIVKNNKPELITQGELFANIRIYVMLPYDDTKILIGTRENGFYLYDTTLKENAITPFEVGTPEMITNSAIYNGVTLPNGTFAIGTFADGLIVFDKNGKITQHLNTQSGLPNQFVLSIYFNQKASFSNLWFTCEDFGILKADILSPVSYWGSESGLSGSVSDAKRFHDTLFITTNTGLFYLKENPNSNPRFVSIEDLVYCWNLFEYNIPNKKTSKLMLGSQDGIFEINHLKCQLIENIEHVYTITQTTHNPEYLYMGSYEGLSLLKFDKEKWKISERNSQIKAQINSILETSNYIALGTLNDGVICLKNFDDNQIITIDSARNLPIKGNDFKVKRYKEESLIICGAGLYTINEKTFFAEPFTEFGLQFCNQTKGVFNFVEDREEVWLSVYDNATAENQLMKVSTKNKLQIDSVFAKRIPAKPAFLIYPDGNYVWIGNEKGLFKYNKSIAKDYAVPFQTIITKIKNTGDSLLFSGNYVSIVNNTVVNTYKQDSTKIPVLNYKNNDFVFEYAAPFFEQEQNTLYSYRLVGESDEWSKWTTDNKINLTNLYEGDYRFEVKAKNIYNTESSVAFYEFNILPPWYRTLWAYLIFAILIGFAIYVIVKLNTRRLVKDKQRLEKIVKERTIEIQTKNTELEQQKEEIIAQRDEIEVQRDQVIGQRDEIEKQRDKIADQKKSIMDSIHYAKRIQTALLPPDEMLQSFFPEHFVLFRPRDIVSGDFYWAYKRDNKFILAAADCTGHGVPGAFMSMLGMAFLNEIIFKLDEVHANLILNELRNNVKKSLRQTGKENEAKDGMDISLCIIDYDNMKLEYAGAYNPLYLIRNGEVETFKADRMPIGIYIKEKESFTNNTTDLQKGDCLYIFSDGYVDQFGGESGNKLMSGRFKDVLLENHQKTPIQQKEALNIFIENWIAHTNSKGELFQQIDDMLVIGIRI